MSMSDFPVIKNEDFESIVIHLSFLNMTTKTEVSEGKRYIGDQLQSDQGAQIYLVEFREDGMVIEVPARSGAVGHQLNMKIWTEGPAPHLEISFVVTVDAVERMSPSRDQFEVTFNEYDSRAWKALQQIFENRQNEINDFLRAAKGY